MLTRAISVVALAMASVGVGGGAFAAAGDGSVQVRVVEDSGAHGYVAVETSGPDEGAQTATSRQMAPPLSGVSVTLTDDDGDTLSATTDDDGIATFDLASAPEMTGGQYRVDVANPDPGTYFPAFAANNQEVGSGHEPFVDASGGTPSTVPPVMLEDLANPNNAKLSSNTEFVDVREGASAFVNTAFWYPPYYCQDNPAVCDANQPWDAEDPGNQSAPDEATLLSAPYHLDQPDSGLAENQETGTVYGIAYDRENERIFSAAYAKRGSDYGPAGPGGIYVTDLTSTSYPLEGITSEWTTVPNAGADNHAMDVDNDLGFIPHVGNESLGDIDITDDGQYLFGVNQFDRTVFVYDIAAGGAAGTPEVYTIPNPCAVESDWRPMGTGSARGGSYVGGVCNGQSSADMNDLSAHVFEFDPASGTFGAEVLSDPLTYSRGFTIRPVLCDGTLDGEGRWFSWTDTYPWGPNEQQAEGCDGPAGGTGSDGTSQGNHWVAHPQPMLSDIVEETNGDLVLSFRDRLADQGGAGALMETVEGEQFYNVWGPASGGDLVRGCRLADGSYVLDPNYAGEALDAAAVCTDNNVDGAANGGQETNFREYYVGDWRVNNSHTETFFGGMALSRAEPTLVISGMDPADGIMTQGISAIDRNGQRPEGSLGVVTDSPSDRFSKGAGMADLEVLCDVAPIQVGNRVWNDVDGNGVQDPGEPGIAGVTVNLYDDVGEVIGTTITNDTGAYYFDATNVNVEDDDPGNDGLAQSTDYTARLDNPDDYDEGGPLAGLSPTIADAGEDDGHDSDGVIPDGGTYSEIDLTTGGAGENDHTLDFGFSGPQVSVGDFVWVDSNGDGIQDEGEPGIEGVTLVITGPDDEPVIDVAGNPVDPVTTDADGHYSFDGLPVLPPGESYTVTIDQGASADALAPYEPTVEGAGDDPAADSSTWTAESGDLSEDGAADTTLDFGFVEPVVSIGDYLWIDGDGDGVQDEGESPVPGATVRLLDDEGVELATTTTDENGFYAFTDLPPDTEVTVEFPTTVTVDEIDYILVPPGQGEDPAADSNADQASGQAPVTTPAEGENSGEPGMADDPTIDAGYVPAPVSIGDYLWIDADGDGVQDEGELPVADATVRLLDVDGNELATTTTDENGFYAFTDLPPNTDVIVEFPTSVTLDGVDHPLTVQGAGDDPAADSNADPETGRAAVTTPMRGDNMGTPGEADLPTIDAGYRPNPVSIGHYVWIDEDGDGVQDSGESPVAGVTVDLLDESGEVIASTTTDENGYYVFTDLLPDTQYGVKFPTTVIVDGVEHTLSTPGQGSDRGTDSNPDQSSGIAWVTTPATGSNSAEPGEADDPTIDAGYTPDPTAPLPSTGFDNVAPILASALFLLGGGFLLAQRGSRRARSTS